MPAFLLLAAMVLPFLAALSYFVVAAGSGWAPALYAATKIVMVALPALAYWRWGPPAGLPRTSRMSAIGIGLAAGGVMATAILAAALGPLAGTLSRAAPAIAAKVAEFGVAGPVSYVMATIGLAFVHSALEEYYWRWFIWRRLREHCGGTAAHVLAGIAFALHHAVIAAVYVGVARGLGLAAIVALAGMAWSVIYRRTGTLIASWLAHVAADLALMVIGWLAISAGPIA